MEEVTRPQFVRDTAGGERDSSFQALNRGLPTSRVRRDLFALRDDKSDDFQILTFHQGGRSRASQPRSERSDIDDVRRARTLGRNVPVPFGHTATGTTRYRISGRQIIPDVGQGMLD